MTSQDDCKADIQRVAVAALVREGRMLLAHRHPDRRWYPDCWDLVGGHIEAGESALAAMQRECHEELGVRVENAKPFHLPTSNPGLDLQAFLVRSWEGEPTNQAPDEHDDLRWFTAEEIRQLTIADPASLEAIVSLLA